MTDDFLQRAHSRLLVHQLLSKNSLKSHLSKLSGLTIPSVMWVIEFPALQLGNLSKGTMEKTANFLIYNVLSMISRTTKFNIQFIK